MQFYKQSLLFHEPRHLIIFLVTGLRQAICNCSLFSTISGVWQWFTIYAIRKPVVRNCDFFMDASLCKSDIWQIINQFFNSYYCQLQCLLPSPHVMLTNFYQSPTIILCNKQFDRSIPLWRFSFNLFVWCELIMMDNNNNLYISRSKSKCVSFVH